MDNPDLAFDIDALFEHLVIDLGHDLDDELDWQFRLCSTDQEKLEEVASELDGEFDIHIQGEDELFGEDAESAGDDALLTVIRRAALDREEVRAIAERMQQIADKHGLKYEGVDCYEPFDEEELFGWIEPEDAGWRLRYLTDCGLESNAEMPWSFLITTPTLEATNEAAALLSASGFGDRDEYDEPDEEGNYGICVFVRGRNNEFELNATSEKISDIVLAEGGRLVGVQFYTREGMAEVFGDDDPA